MRGLLLLPLLVLSGCVEYGPEQRESARVLQSHFEAPHRAVETYRDSEGNRRLHTVATSPAYWVVFECDHGQFAVSDKATWQRVRVGETWTVVYREGKDGNGVVTRYDFRRVEPASSERSPR